MRAAHHFQPLPWRYPRDSGSPVRESEFLQEEIRINVEGRGGLATVYGGAVLGRVEGE